MAQIMTTKEMANYLKLHQITISKLSKEGKIPSIRIGGSGDLTRKSLMRGSPTAKEIMQDCLH